MVTEKNGNCAVDTLSDALMKNQEAGNVVKWFDEKSKFRGTFCDGELFSDGEGRYMSCLASTDSSVVEKLSSIGIRENIDKQVFSHGPVSG